YGQKDREFEPFFTLPHEADEPMEIALSFRAEIYDAEEVRRRLLAGGWRLADPMAVSRTPWSFQKYIQSSRAEFSVAKHGYVATRSGWFSDRTATYLASGRPAVVQDTGFSDWLPTGSGVLAFRSREEALAGIEAIKSRYDFHSREARAVAEEFFDARKVLSMLLHQA